jgi:hypothetical protein
MVGGDVDVWVAGVFAKIAQAQGVAAEISVGEEGTKQTHWTFCEIPRMTYFRF